MSGSTECFDPALRAWWVEPLIATLGFAVFITFFGLFEQQGQHEDGGHHNNNVISRIRFLLRPPHQLLRAAAAYWAGVWLWVALVPPPVRVSDGCPASLWALFRLVVEVACGVVLYDALFFIVHVAFHRFGLRAHRRHHALRRTPRAGGGWMSAAKVLDHSLVDGALQVLVNIACQRAGPFGAKTRLARWLHNVAVTFLLSEAHTTCAWPKIARRWFVGVRDHHLHHAHGGPPFEQFFGYLDHFVGSRA
jgi:hypothetical protein